MINAGIFTHRKLKVNNLFFDGHVDENVDYNITVTRSPVEYGANVPDNAYVDPAELRFTAYVSEIAPVALTPEGVFNTFKRTADALEVLRQLSVNREIVDVTCNSGYFTNFIITRVSSNINVNSATLMTIDLILQEMMFVGDTNRGVPNNNDYKGIVNRGDLQPSAVNG